MTAMSDITTRHQDCNRCGELQGDLYLLASESIITAKLSEGRWPFGHWAKIKTGKAT